MENQRHNAAADQYILCNYVKEYIYIYFAIAVFWCFIFVKLLFRRFPRSVCSIFSATL